ncbi:MAG TPA: CPBP family intramembrane glutamic endopeptidase, partial [Gemmataceae bacterium]|nr:CPBP family intramembrane glutamic endopeptidase [Gemmataceae bacterium]
SFFFGAIHVLPAQGFMAVLMGILLHYTYVTTRSLAVPMLLHFLNNAMSVAGYRVLRAFEKIDTAPGDISLWVYWSAALLLLAAGWALYQTRARLVALPDSPLPPWQPDFPGVALPPPGSGTVVTHPWPSLLTVGLVVVAAAGFWTTVALDVAGLLP